MQVTPSRPTVCPRSLRHATMGSSGTASVGRQPERKGHDQRSQQGCAQAVGGESRKRWARKSAGENLETDAISKRCTSPWRYDHGNLPEVRVINMYGKGIRRLDQGPKVAV